MFDSSEFEKNLGCTFKNKALLKLAFTHTTYVFEHKLGHYDSNQRLEFIGDAVIDLIIGRKLYELKPQADEGYLSKTRSLVVCEKSFAAVARTLKMGDMLLLGKGEDMSGGRDKDSTLADAFESVIAAVYFDQGFAKAEEVVLRILDSTIKDAIDGKIILDYKSKLLEIAQTKKKQHTITFHVVNETGPAHAREFEVEVMADGEISLAIAKGKSKKDAEQNCAREAIQKYHEVFG